MKVFVLIWSGTGEIIEVFSSEDKAVQAQKYLEDAQYFKVNDVYYIDYYEYELDAFNESNYPAKIINSVEEVKPNKLKDFFQSVVIYGFCIVFAILLILGSKSCVQILENYLKH
jgi:hypothetical protein